MLVIFVILLLVVVIGGLPHWPHSAGWGYGPSGVGGILLVLFVVWLLFGGGLRYF